MERQRWIDEKKLRYAQLEDACEYSQGLGIYARQRDQMVIQELLPSKCGFALDMPCGTGRFSKFLMATGWETIAADYSENMLMFARKEVNAASVRCDGFRLPFPEATFDLVLCLRLIFHYPEPTDLLEEIARVLKRDGVALFDTLNPFSLRRLIAIFCAGRYRASVGRQLWFVSHKRVEQLLANIDLELENKVSTYLLPTRAYRVLPSGLWGWLSSIERFCPTQMRVLTFWRVKKR